MAQDAIAFTQQKQCGHMSPRPPLNMVRVTVFQDTFDAFTPVLRAVNLQSSLTGRMITSDVNGAKEPKTDMS